MRKLTDLTGSLLASILMGGAIVRVKDDGFDHHVIVKVGSLNPDDQDAEVKRDYAYETHSTSVYEKGDHSFKLVASLNKNLRIVRSEFDASVAKEEEFKAKYPNSAWKPNDATGPASTDAQN